MSILFVPHEEEITEGPATVSLPRKAGVGRQTSDLGRENRPRIFTDFHGSEPFIFLPYPRGSVAAAFSPSAHFSDNAGLVEGRPLEGRVFSATQAGL